MKLIITLLLILVPFNCYAHKAIGLKPERTMKYMEQIEAYFKTEYNLELKNKVTVYVTKTNKEYQTILEKCNVPNAKQIAATTHAVTSKTNTILIDDSALSDKHFYFILAHEMVHRYQFENNPNIHEDYVLLEGQADNIASKISGYYIETRNHNIPYEKLKSREGFFKACKNNRTETIEQIRYYTEGLPLKLEKAEKDS